MNNLVINQLVATLHRTHRSAIQNLANLRRALSAIEIRGDAADQARGLLERRRLIGEIEAEHSRIGKIEGAMQRLADDRFGLCTGCGMEIPARRLEFQPWFERCVGCQAQMERGASDEWKRAALHSTVLRPSPLSAHPINSS
jgi:RNA polymerase-binding transcription factor DksA